MRNALALHTLELCAQAAYFFADQAAIHFQLRFARAATRANPAALTLKVGPHPCKPARQVLQPGQLHLKLALPAFRSEEHTSELQSLMRISYAVFCLKTTNQTTISLFSPKAAEPRT